jgi:MFS family permease
MIHAGPAPRRAVPLLLASAGLRATATSLTGVLLGLYLAKRGLTPGEIGAVATAGLAGATLGALAVTLGGDRFGRRRSLILINVASAAGAAALLAARSVWLIAAVAFLGMVNAMGRDRGGASILEQAVLPSTVDDARRTRVFAWYAAIQDGGHALGSLLAGLPALLVGRADTSPLAADRIALACAPVLLAATAIVCLALPAAIEPGHDPPSRPAAGSDAPPVSPPGRGRLSPHTRGVLWRISTLFLIDGIGGGLLVTTLLSYFFFERFGVGAGSVSILFFAARLANVASHFGAAWLAKRIGLVNTMVFTHIPSSLFLLAVAVAPSFPIAAALFLLRESLVEMDVPTRQSYVMGVVGPEERTTASGVVNLVRLAAWGAGAGVAGVVMQRVSLATPLVLGATIKIVYDLLLYAAFRRTRPPEEKVAGSA